MIIDFLENIYGEFAHITENENGTYTAAFLDYDETERNRTFDDFPDAAAWLEARGYRF